VGANDDYPPVARRRPFLRSWALVSALLLAGCAPEYNWREVRYAEDGCRAMMPGKPSSLTRPIHLEGRQVDMAMHGAQAGGATFAVASVRLPGATEAERAAALAAMGAQMVRNIEGREQVATEAVVPLIDAAGVASGSVPATRIEAEGRANGGPVRLLAGFTGRGERVYQVVVMGAAPDREQAQIFLDGFKLVR
jgi:hypothetical protein